MGRYVATEIDRQVGERICVLPCQGDVTRKVLPWVGVGLVTSASYVFYPSSSLLLQGVIESIHVYALRLFVCRTTPFHKSIQSQVEDFISDQEPRHEFFAPGQTILSQCKTLFFQQMYYAAGLFCAQQALSRVGLYYLFPIAHREKWLGPHARVVCTESCCSYVPPLRYVRPWLNAYCHWPTSSRRVILLNAALFGSVHLVTPLVYALLVRLGKQISAFRRSPNEP
jgi:hypothetical protein